MNFIPIILPFTAFLSYKWIHVICSLLCLASFMFLEVYCFDSKIYLNFICNADIYDIYTYIKYICYIFNECLYVYYICIFICLLITYLYVYYIYMSIIYNIFIFIYMYILYIYI